MLGTDFPYPQFYPTGATVVQIDARAVPEPDPDAVWTA